MSSINKQSLGVGFARGVGRRRGAAWLASRRGVASVLAMMFIIMFGSLAVAMAVSSKGNIVTSATHQRVLRAHGAAETGMRVGLARMAEASARFVVSESDMTQLFASRLWQGNRAGLGTIVVLKPKTGRQDQGDPAGLAAAIAEVHGLDQDLVTEVGISTPTVANAIAGASGEYASTHWVYTPAVAIEPRISGSTMPPLCFQVTYAPLANGTDIRVISTGYDYSYRRNGAPVTRTIMQDVRLSKRVNQAIISPTRIMLGRNVMVEGDLGVKYTQTDHNNGDPLIVKSDFYHMGDANLDSKLEDFFAFLASNDVDFDNRVRVGHPIEGASIPTSQTYLDGSGNQVNPFTDVTGDGYVDDFDIFVKHFDTNGDGRLVIGSALTPGTPAAGLAPEFTLDDNLAILVDSALPDRNRNGVGGYTDSNSNGYWDSADGNMLDYDAALAGAGENGNRDQVLGYRDGFLDRKDQYGKVRGRVTYQATKGQWETDQGPISERVRGAISGSVGSQPVKFGATAAELPAFDVNSLASQRTDLQNAADGQSFERQVASNLGISETQLPTYVEAQSPGPSVKRYLRLDPDVAPYDGLPDNWTSAYFEKMPFNSPNFSDYYYRPVYENMTFKDVQIPLGNNGLFKKCTFIGVTWVHTSTSNQHVLWNEYGKMVLDTGTGRPKLASPRSVYGDTASENQYPTMLSQTGAGQANHLLLMGNPPLDKADLPADIAAITQGFNLLPEPLTVGGVRVHDTKPRSNNVRFHDCTFVGSIVSDVPGNYTHVRNKMQYTGATRFVKQNPDAPTDTSLNPEAIDAGVIAKSSMMLPNYSVDLGTFNSPPGQNLNLSGTIIAGVMDVRGSANIDGSLLLTFSPTVGSGPLRDALGNPIGNPAGFNTTLGYFGPDDGDEESLDPETLPIVGGVRIVGYDTNGDGLADVGPNEAPPGGAVPVPFNGFGRIRVRYNPDLPIPDGVMLALQFRPLAGTYREGKP